MMITAQSTKLAEWIKKGFGLDPAKTHRVVIDIQANDVVHVYAEMYGCDEMLDVDPQELFCGVEVTILPKPIRPPAQGDIVP